MRQALEEYKRYKVNMKLEFIDNKKSSVVSKKFLEDFLQFMEQALIGRKILSAPSDKELTVAFVSAKDIQNLNKNFLKKDCVTDVLSFAPLQGNSFGELALCGEQIKSQAEEHHLSVEEETIYLILHGFLHLLGYHHEQGGESAKRMYKIQDEVFDEWQKVFKNIDHLK